MRGTLRWALLTTTLGLGLAGAADAADLAAKLATAAGSDTVAVVHIANLDAMLKKADRLGQVWNAQVSAMFPLIAPGVIGHIDLTQPITAIFVSPKKYTPSGPLAGGLVCTSRDAQALLAALGTPGASADGITAYTTPAGPEQFFAADGQEAAFVTSRELLAAALKASPSGDVLPKVTGDIVASVPVANVLKLYESDIDSAKAAMVEALKKAPPEQGMSPESIAAFMKLYVDMLVAIGQQVDDFGVGIEIDGGDMRLRERFQAVPGSKLEALLKSQAQPSDSLLGLMPESAPMRFDFAFRGTPEVVEAYGAFFDIFNVLSADGTSKPAFDFAVMRPSFEKFLQNMGPRVACAILPAAGKGAFQLVEFFEYKDQAGFGAMVEESMKLWKQPLMDFYKRVGMAMEMDMTPAKDPGFPPGTYEWTFLFPNLPAAEKEAFVRLYGTEGMVMNIAPAGRYMVAVFGADRVALVKEWSEKLNAATTLPAAPALPKTPGVNVFGGIIDVAGYFNMISAFAPPEKREEMAKQFAPFVGVKQEILMASSIDGAIAYFEMLYPLETTLKAAKAASSAQH